MNSWVSFLKEWSQDNNVPYSRALKDPAARAAYNKRKGVKAGHKGAVSKTRKGRLDYTTKKGDKVFHRGGRDVKLSRDPFER